MGGVAEGFHAEEEVRGKKRYVLHAHLFAVVWTSRIAEKMRPLCLIECTAIQAHLTLLDPKKKIKSEWIG